MAVSIALAEPRTETVLRPPPAGPFRVSMSSICIPPEAKQLLADCLDGNAIGQSGYIVAFERALAEFMGVQHAVAVTNGTMADAVACAAMKIRYGKTRAVVPALTFVAQPNAARMAGLEVEFCDVKEDWTLDLSNVEEWWPYLLFPAHLMGRAASVWEIPADFQFIEDTCESLGSSWNGQKLGTFGAMGTFSFFVSHTVTLGEGGAIVTDDGDLAQLCRQLRSHGRASESDAFRKFSFPHPGFNAKMSGLVAAFGLGVFHHVREYLALRRANYLDLNHRLNNRFPERPGEAIVPHAYPVAFTSETARNAAMQNLLAAGVECRKFFSALTTEPAWAPTSRTGWSKAEAGFPCAEHIGRTHLLVPCHQNMSAADVAWLADRVLEQPGLCGSPSC